MITILTTRFTDETFEENMIYRQLHNDIACIYGSPQPMPPHVLYRSLNYVIEMNNTKNRVEGIGLIRNIPDDPHKTLVYNNCNFNRYVFTGNYRLEREEIPNELLSILDVILFTGKTHMKRGAGFTTLTPKLLRHPCCNELDLTKELYNAFSKRYKQ